MAPRWFNRLMRHTPARPSDDQVEAAAFAERQDEKIAQLESRVQVLEVRHGIRSEPFESNRQSA